MFQNKLLAFFNEQVNQLADSYGLSQFQAAYCIYSAISNGRSIDRIDQYDIEEWLFDLEDFPLNQIQDDFLNLEKIVE
jgi:hypothetical protein